MDTETVFASSLLIILLLLIVVTWKKLPTAKFIVFARTDGDTTKGIAINTLEVIDSKGDRKEIIGIDGKGQTTKGWSNTTAANTAALNSEDIVFDGKKMGYVKDTTVIGPVIGYLPAAQGATGYLMFVLGCSSKLARINIKTPEDDVSRVNIQRVKVYLLDKDRSLIEGSDQVIPISVNIPQTTHHITYV